MYEVVPIDDGRVRVQSVDRPLGGDPMAFVGTSEDAAAWLDGRGSQLFVGSAADAERWQQDQQGTAKDFTLPIASLAGGVALVLIGVLPIRKTPHRGATARLAGSH